MDRTAIPAATLFDGRRAVLDLTSDVPFVGGDHDQVPAPGYEINTDSPTDWSLSCG